MENNINKTQRFHFTHTVKEHLALAISLLCIFLFLYTAYAKIIDHNRFLNGLYHVEVIGRFALYISWLVPFAEIAAAVLMIIPQTLKLGLYNFLGLMILFTVYIMSVLLWAKKLPCHCGGVIEKLSWEQHVWFNLVFIALALFALGLLKTNN